MTEDKGKPEAFDRLDERARFGRSKRAWKTPLQAPRRSSHRVPDRAFCKKNNASLACSVIAR
ncbi:MAG: hypothetical protein WCI05_13520, partial [Myxococcales bacterium]